MRRHTTADLKEWLGDPERRPLIIRGARQVGKTWLVRDLAREEGLDLIELNFERDPRLLRCFRSNDPRTILNELSLVLDRTPGLERSLLFLDEIQAAGEVLAKLRWFFEDMPELPVIAAGSLLEFTLADHDFSMPVGRVSYAHIEPMSFPEFLDAHGQSQLLDALSAWRPGQDLSEVAHAGALAWFHRHAMVGGMPAVVAADVAGREPKVCRRLQADLIATYRDDFAKYAGRMDRTILDLVLETATRSVGQKFVYARVGEGVRQRQAKRALELLASARILTLVRKSSANGLPLGAEVREKFRKVALLDVGILHALLGTPAEGAHPSWADLPARFVGQVAEQMATQQLRRREADRGGRGPELWYWRREKGGAGEIDHLVQVRDRIVPIELKSGASGSMKSLHQFMHDKRLDLAVRCDRNLPSLQDMSLKTTRGDAVRYRLVNIPLTLLWNIDAILRDL